MIEMDKSGVDNQRQRNNDNAQNTSRPDFYRIPAAAAGNRIGLYGGSFNPPHEGHLQVALTAMRRLQLDQLWWLVTPGNPLKDHSALNGLDARLTATAQMVRHPRMRICAIEATLGSCYTADTLRKLKLIRPHLHFTWIMGADNLESFHRWQNWREIVETVPIAVINRPGATLSPLFSPMAITYAKAKARERNASQIACSPAPCWVFLHCPLNPMSSSFIRDNVATQTKS